MSELDFGILNTNGNEDDHALRYLAGSLILHWAELPDDLRARIYEMAVSGKVVGLPNTVQLKQKIDSLLRRNESEGADA